MHNLNNGLADWKNPDRISIGISTCNRCVDLEKTLNVLISLGFVLEQIYIIDDSSNDITEKFIRYNFASVNYIKNSQNLGYLVCRNRLLNECNSEFMIILDDDANPSYADFGANVIKIFEDNPRIGLISCPVFWSEENDFPLKPKQSEGIFVNDFVGCGNVWRISAWREICDFPTWFLFYGEESFASVNLIRANWELFESECFLIHHRVDLKTRKLSFINKYRRSILSFSNGIFLFVLTRPLFPALKIIFYSVKMKLFKLELALLFLTFLRFIYLFPKLCTSKYRMSSVEFARYKKLSPKIVFYSF